MSDPKTVLKKIKENGCKYVDLRFTDPRGKMQHLAHAVETITEETFEEGLMFDGSSIAGWKAINESDMTLMLDPTTAVMDPFAAQPSMTIMCDIYEPGTGQPYNRDPRGIAKKAEAYVKETGIGDTAFFGPEIEFFVFDDVRFKVSMNKTSVEIDSEEGPYVTDKVYPDGNLGHRPRIKGGYFPVPPVDQGADLRAEMLTIMKDMGLDIEKHHHEVAPSQHELGAKFTTMVKAADGCQIYKYVVHNVAQQYGKTATFMPKPIKGDNGSGMHVHQSLSKGGVNLFSGDGYGGLSQMALWYIGGIFKHARAINAFANSTTNSYKRLVPGYEAPVMLAYSARNRSASCRIPYVANPKARRIEIRFPDPMNSGYLIFAALMMAGLDGIKNQIDPGEPSDKDLYDLPPEEEKNIPTVCHSLDQALDALDGDRDFLKAGGVFTDDFIDSYIALKMGEVTKFRAATHPLEYSMYYQL